MIQVCSKCHRELELNKFYKFKDNTLDTVCKECRLEGRKDYHPSDYFPLMELYDIPFVRTEWNILMKRNIERAVINNVPYKSIFGKYLSLMKLKGWIHWTYADSDKLNNMADAGPSPV